MKSLATIISHRQVQCFLRDYRQAFADAKRIRKFYLDALAESLDITLSPTCAITAGHCSNWSIEVGRSRRKLKHAIWLAESKLGREHRKF